MRRVLTIGVPAIVIVVAGTIYLLSGRYVSTDNAYVKADMVAVSPKVAGTITDVFVEENQFVEKEAPLFKIDPTDYQIMLQQAEAKLKQAVAQVKGQQARYRMTLERIELAKSSAEYYQREFDRQNKLARRDFVSRQKLDEAKHNLDTARHLAKMLAANLEEIEASLDGEPDAPVEEQSAYRAAKSAADNAALNLERTIVRAPFPGVLGKRPQVGDTVAHGEPVVSLISRQRVWVEANFKETQLTGVHAGQDAIVTIDTYPNHEWHGRVASIAQGTGSQFSVLPAQNATGNWVKVVQRVPVLIEIERRDGDPEIRAGMSCEAEIDTASGSEDSSHT
ncbi:MAG: HlyD family secretion protein [Parvibaculum sp.]|nr:HlyD family secretion protein [Parvibaculum sp.]